MKWETCQMPAIHYSLSNDTGTLGLMMLTISTSEVTMKYLAAYLLLTIGGNAAPSAKDITALLATVGIEAESERVEALIAQLAGKDINELIAEGTSKLASVPSGGAAAAAAPAAGAAAAEEKKEEKKEEAKEESDDDMGFGLFD
ncbi:60S acidic ribosomal protein P2 [Podila minutissima]|uniref:60S acidic ribosomal protein P2 n=1 Tax=Podila minutissima TaxID=64525 RepID=A0A9P5SSN8_9FUNG|nr:60S acidic ribosomal protein P2 [Podila minutissima]